MCSCMDERRHIGVPTASVRLNGDPNGAFVLRFVITKRDVETFTVYLPIGVGLGSCSIAAGEKDNRTAYHLPKGKKKDRLLRIEAVSVIF